MIVRSYIADRLMETAFPSYVNKDPKSDLYQLIAISLYPLERFLHKIHYYQRERKFYYSSIGDLVYLNHQKGDYSDTCSLSVNSYLSSYTINNLPVTTNVFDFFSSWPIGLSYVCGFGVPLSNPEKFEVVFDGVDIVMYVYDSDYIYKSKYPFVNWEQVESVSEYSYGGYLLYRVNDYYDPSLDLGYLGMESTKIFVPGYKIVVTDPFHRDDNDEPYTFELRRGEMVTVTCYEESSESGRSFPYTGSGATFEQEFHFDESGIFYIKNPVSPTYIIDYYVSTDSVYDGLVSYGYIHDNSERYNRVEMTKVSFTRIFYDTEYDDEHDVWREVYYYLLSPNKFRKLYNDISLIYARPYRFESTIDISDPESPKMTVSKTDVFEDHVEDMTKFTLKEYRITSVKPKANVIINVDGETYIKFNEGEDISSWVEDIYEDGDNIIIEFDSYVADNLDSGFDIVAVLVPVEEYRSRFEDYYYIDEDSIAFGFKIPLSEFIDPSYYPEYEFDESILRTRSDSRDKFLFGDIWVGSDVYGYDLLLDKIVVKDEIVSPDFKPVYVSLYNDVSALLHFEYYDGHSDIVRLPFRIKAITYWFDTLIVLSEDGKIYGVNVQKNVDDDVEYWEIVGYNDPDIIDITIGPDSRLYVLRNTDVLVFDFVFSKVFYNYGTGEYIFNRGATLI